MSPTPQFQKIFQTLQKHSVDYILIGGVCAVLHGAALNTGDMDIVPERTPDNLERLSGALQEMRAYYREHPPFRILPNAQRLDSAGHHLLVTDFGQMDVLGSVVGKRDYAMLLPDTIEIEIEDIRIRMLDLPKLIEIKRETGRDKDKAALPLLEEVLEMRNKPTQT